MLELKTNLQKSLKSALAFLRLDIRDDSLTWLAKLLVVGQRSNCHVTLFIGWLSVLMILAWVSDPRQQGRNCTIFYTLVSEVTHHHLFYWPHRQILIQCGRETTQRQEVGLIGAHLGDWKSLSDRIQCMICTCRKNYVRIRKRKKEVFPE